MTLQQFLNSSPEFGRCDNRRYGRTALPLYVLRQEAGALAIDLKNVSLVDREAVQLLALAEYNGTELRNCPMYVHEWVTRDRTDLRGELPDDGTGVGKVPDVLDMGLDGILRDE